MREVQINKQVNKKNVILWSQLDQAEHMQYMQCIYAHDQYQSKGKT